MMLLLLLLFIFVDAIHATAADVAGMARSLLIFLSSSFTVYAIRMVMERRQFAGKWCVI